MEVIYEVIRQNLYTYNLFSYHGLIFTNEMKCYSFKHYIVYNNRGSFVFNFAFGTSVCFAIMAIDIMLSSIVFEVERIFLGVRTTFISRFSEDICYELPQLHTARVQ